MNDESTDTHDETSSVRRTDVSPREWSSSQLLDGRSEAIIIHAGEVYRLRCTRNNKLILHK